MREEDTGEDRQEETESPAGDSLFAGPLTEAQLHNYYSIERIQQMQAEALQVEADSLTEPSATEA